jgi:hypothetical protein
MLSKRVLQGGHSVLTDVPLIPEGQLLVNRWYVGRGRNGNVGLWTGKHFLVIGSKFDEWVIKCEPLYRENDGCFQPFQLVDEGSMVSPFGASGWDAHYGTTLRFG